MTLLRAPCTIPNAITRIAGQIGWPEVSRIARRRERTVRYWAAPKPKGAPTIDQAVALDAAFVAAGGQGQPLLETYSQLLGVAVSEEIACRTALLSDLSRASAECGEAISHGILAGQNGASPLQIQRAIGEAEQACSAMAVVVRRLLSFLPSARGRGGKPVGEPL